MACKRFPSSWKAPFWSPFLPKETISREKPSVKILIPRGHVTATLRKLSTAIWCLQWCRIWKQWNDGWQWTIIRCVSTKQEEKKTFVISEIVLWLRGTRHTHIHMFVVLLTSMILHHFEYVYSWHNNEGSTVKQKDVEFVPLPCMLFSSV